MLPRRQAAIAFARDRRRFRIDLVEICENRGDRAAHIVDVEAIEAGLPRRSPDALIVMAHPVDEGRDVGVAPHPGGKPLERRFGVGAWRPVAHVAVDGGGVRPVRLDGDDGEAVLLDQPAGDRGAGAVEFRRAVARLAEQHDAAVGEAVEQLRRMPDRRSPGSGSAAARDHLRQAARACVSGTDGCSPSGFRPPPSPARRSAARTATPPRSSSS